MKRIVVVIATTLLSLVATAILGTPQAAAADKPKIALLMVSKVRTAPVNGFKKGLTEMGMPVGERVDLKIYDAGGERAKLAGLAKQIIASSPDVAIAAGGIEADALRAASQGSGVPVVYLAVASAVKRGLAKSMKSSGNNMTGVDANDTKLTARRLWLITKLLPRAKKVRLFNDTSTPPSVESAEVAKKYASSLGLELIVDQVRGSKDIITAINRVKKDNTDAILLLPSAPVWQLVKSNMLPVALAQGIPIMGVNQSDIKRGAFASYAGSRYEMGRQAARMVRKVLAGTKPGQIPVETPQKLELIINKSMADRLGLKIPDAVWSLANKVVQLPVQ